uniref:Mos1 transposase HTH domain-containing protein n=1 Tax=Caenorhabditis japonica TaxID=281687 RepID=A0A8R1E0E0_CAEJA
MKVPEVHRRLVQVYKAEAPYENTIRIWFGKFENKDFSFDDASRSELSVWWSVHGVHHWKLLDERKTITTEYYSAQLQKVRAQLNLSPLKHHRVPYFHDNARPHVAKTAKSLLATFSWTVLAYQPYIPDLAPTDYHLFSDMHRSLEGTDFKTKRIQFE